MATNLQLENPLSAVPQSMQDENGTKSPLAFSPTAVGIGTATPRRELHVSGAAPGDANDAQLEIAAAPSGKFMLLGRAATYGFVQCHNSEPLALNPLGNAVGIGTTTPRRRLHVSGAAPDNANDAQLEISSREGNFMLLGRAATYGFVQCHNSEPLALNPLGNNVGIGTTEPREALDVKGNISATGDVRLAGSDCAEQFHIADGSREPGAVMVIGNDEVLVACSEPYDTKVAGVLSGAGDYKPGIILGQHTSLQDGMPLALSGKVYCKVDATYAAIAIGDLLTTSSTIGHAMKASDVRKASGSILGKALRSCAQGRGLIPILVSLQ